MNSLLNKSTVIGLFVVVIISACNLAKTDNTANAVVNTDIQADTISQAYAAKVGTENSSVVNISGTGWKSTTANTNTAVTAAMSHTDLLNDVTYQMNFNNLKENFGTKVSVDCGKIAGTRAFTPNEQQVYLLSTYEDFMAVP